MKKFLLALIPIAIFVIVKNQLSDRENRRLADKDYQFRLEQDATKRQHDVMPHQIYEDVTPCLYTPPKDSVIDGLRLRLQVLCDAQTRPVKGHEICSYMKDLDSSTMEIMEANCIPITSSSDKLLNYLSDKKKMKDLGRIDSIKRVIVNGMEGVRIVYQTTAKVDDLTPFYCHVQYYLIHRKYMLGLHYIVASAKGDKLYALIYMQSCLPLFDNMAHKSTFID